VTQLFRLPTGGQIDRGQILRFTFDGQEYEGHPGDTLASALLANGVRLIARSFKYHRPRGIFSAGAEEPSALVQLEGDADTEPNRRATDIALYNGLRASSQHAWPRLDSDLGALVGPFGRLFPAGFYYKTFMQPRAGWRHVWEPLLRRMAGLGRAPSSPDPSRYDKRHAHCDVLVVGAGPAGLSAALAAGRSGARVILADSELIFGGALLRRPYRIGGEDGTAWAAAVIAELTGLPEVWLLPATTVLGRYDDNYLIAAERVGDLLGPAASSGLPRQRLWHIRARHIVLATGALERPLVFAGNDRPGVMLAGAVETYLRRYAVLPGRRAVLFADHDDAYHTAAALAEAGATVAAIIDPRPAPGPTAQQLVRDIPLYSGHTIVGTAGRKALRRVRIRPLADSARSIAIDCDLLAVSGGWNPVLHLFAQAQGRLRFDENLAAFVPDGKAAGMECVGAARGSFAVSRCLAEGTAAGAHAVASCGFGNSEAPPTPSVAEEDAPSGRLSLLPLSHDGRRAFVDLHNDVTAADIALAAREGFVATEHVKRYTTLGMGTDQGKTGNVAGLALLAAMTGRDIGETAPTTFRPPYVPVTFGLLAGRAQGRLADPVRVTPMHEWHVAAGAVFEDVGQWKRARYYPRPEEDMAAAVRRECLAARDGVALLDASTLGKIEVSGPDAGHFLDRIYINRWQNLAVGRCRYGIMCRDDGMVFDDGVGARLGPEHFLLTTTTGNAAAVLDWLEEWLQTEWPELDVFCTSVTEEWTNATLVGWAARDVLTPLAPGLALDSAAFPHMAMREADIGGIPARIFRVSFSGELSYEINVPADQGLELWERLMAVGEPFGITPYGTEAMHVMRAEKGYAIIGQETDGSVTPIDLGLGALVARDKDFLGRRSLARSDTARRDRKQLVGLLPDNPGDLLPEGAAVVDVLGEMPPVMPGPHPGIVGHVTSSYFGARIGRGFALGLVAGGRGRHGERIWAWDAGKATPARIVSPVFYDPEGRRRDG
jgi:sarcosine oxidase subunit alpha